MRAGSSDNELSIVVPAQDATPRAISMSCFTLSLSSIVDPSSTATTASSLPPLALMINALDRASLRLIPRSRAMTKASDTVIKGGGADASGVTAEPHSAASTAVRPP